MASQCWVYGGGCRSLIGALLLKLTGMRVMGLPIIFNYIVSSILLALAFPIVLVGVLYR